MQKKLLYLETDPVFIWKRRKAVCYFSLRTFFTAFQFAVVIPSLWVYLKSLHMQPWFLGLVTAAYELTAMFVLPFTGRVFDLTKRTREILLVLNLFELVGSVVYILPYSAWLPLIGRSISGIGASFRPVIDGEVSWLYPPEHRRRIYAFVQVGSLLGVIVGPIFNFFFQHIDLKIGTLPINSKNAPGAFCAIMWLVMEIYTALVVENLTLQILDGEDAEGVLPLSESQNTDLKHWDESRESYMEEEQGDSNLGEQGNPHRKTMFEAFKEVCRVEILVIFLPSFIAMLMLRNMLLLILLVGNEHFQWGPIAVSLFMVGLAIVVVGTMIAIGILGDKIKDTNLIFFAQSLVIIGLISMIFYAAALDHATILSKVVFCFSTVMATMALPFETIATRSLLTRVTSKENQGFVFGLFVMMRRLAMVLGPIIGGAGYQNLVIHNSTLLAVTVIAVIALGMSLKRIALRSEQLADAEY